jgi:branched-chain amino acid transport system ATP-binding protein
MLKLENVSRRFGGLAALSDVNLEIKDGRVVGLIGPNGAGKSTLINCVTGLDHPTSGIIRFNNVEIQNASPHRISRMGLARTYQNIRLLAEMRAIDNLIVAQHSQGNSTLLHSLFVWPYNFSEYGRQHRYATALLDRFHLNEVANKPAGSLPYGDQRRLEMARALATQPRLILLDEPTAGMNPVETQELGAQILRIRDEGMTLLVVEHDMSLIAQVCDEVYVMNFGQIIAHGTPAEVNQNEAVIEAYLGREE